MFGFLKKFRIKTKELEASLLPVPDCTFGGKGEIEISWFSNGEVQIEVSLKHSGAPSGSRLEFFAKDRFLGSADMQNGFCKSHITFDGQSLSIAVGDSAELRIDGATCYTGRFKPD